jgi:iron complex outermembrane receptor protein
VKHRILVSALCLLFAPFCRSQSDASWITGTVVDPSNAVVEHALIQASAVGSTQRFQTYSDKAGAYRLGPLSSGHYQITVTAPGLRSVEEVEIPLAHAQVAQANLKLAVVPKTEEVIVHEGFAADTTSAGLLGEANPQKLPLSIASFTSQYLVDIQAQTVQEGLRYNPAVNLSSGNNALAFTFEIRGFQAATDPSSASAVAVDGLRSYARTDPIEDKEQIDVMSGPNSFLFGIGTPGGMVNYISKRPTAAPLHTIRFGSFGGAETYGTGDFGGPIVRGLNYRANLMMVGKGNTGVKEQSHQRHFESGALDWQVKKNLLWSFNFSHFQRDILHGDDLFTVNSTVTVLPTAPDATANYMAWYSSAKDRFNRTGSTATWLINKDWSLRTGFRYTALTSYRHRTSDAITDNAGDFTMTRNYYEAGVTTYQGYSFLEGNFKTASIQHKLTVGFVDDNSRTLYAWPYANGKVQIGAAGAYNLYKNNVYGDDKSTVTVGAPAMPTEDATYPTLIAADQVRFNQHWALLAGLTFAKIIDKTWTYTGYLTSAGTTTVNPEYNSYSVSPTASLSYSPVSNVTTYATYTEALQAGVVVGSSYSNVGQVLSPYVSREVESGVKSTIHGVNLNLVGFYINSANSYSDAATTVQSEDGREVHKGVEFSAAGRIGDRLTLTGGFTLLDARVTNTSTANLANKAPLGVPRAITRFYAEYAVPGVKRLSVNGGTSYSSKTWFDSLNTLSVPAVITGDAGVRYESRFRERISNTLRFNVTNLANRNYWTNTGGALNLGAPRLFLASSEFHF